MPEQPEADRTRPARFREYQESIPPAVSQLWMPPGTRRPPNDLVDIQPYTWIMVVLPYVEAVPFYEAAVVARGVGYKDGSYWEGGSAAMSAQLPKLFLCPADNVKSSYSIERVTIRSDIRVSAATQSTAGTYKHSGTGDDDEQFEVPDNGVAYFSSRVTIPSISDGTSQTLLLGERSLFDAEYEAAAKEAARQQLLASGIPASFVEVILATVNLSLDPEGRLGHEWRSRTARGYAVDGTPITSGSGNCHPSEAPVPSRSR